MPAGGIPCPDRGVSSRTELMQLRKPLSQKLARIERHKVHFGMGAAGLRILVVAVPSFSMASFGMFRISACPSWLARPAKVFRKCSVAKAAE